MRPKTIGILGGAGPLAGVVMLEYIFKYAQSLYGCHKDSDFPKVIMISYPFSDMLCLNNDRTSICNELNNCIKELRANGAEFIAIACNTLHAFLPEKSDVTNLLEVLSDELQILNVKNPLVLCTSTSFRNRIHLKYFNCNYPDKHTQKRIDLIIESILKGTCKQEDIVNNIKEIITGQNNNAIVLGCTELSQIATHLSVADKIILDPLKIVAKKLLLYLLHKTRRSCYVTKKLFR